MKIHIYILLLLTVLFTWTCTEQERGQIPLDAIPPQVVTSVSVENVPGGAIISYVIPEDDDLLYVKAVYKLDDGRIMEQKASAYSTKLVIEGLGLSKEQRIKIVTGDRSRNESKPLEVEIHPLDSPIYQILNSLSVTSDFGGLSLLWENPFKADIVINIATLDQDNMYLTAETLYSSATAGKANIRGYDPIEKVFAVFIKDRWGNTTDTISGTYLPIYEEKLDRKLFVRWNPTGIPYKELSGQGWNIEKIWDGLGSETGNGYSWPQDAQWGDSWTMDLGQLAKLSRFKIYQRATNGQLYTGANIKEFDFYGSPHRNVNEDEDTWIYIGSYESLKPSGLPMGQVSDEDKAFAIAGEDYVVDISMPQIRYLRFKINRTWGGSNYMQLMEIEFFGQPSK